MLSIFTDYTVALLRVMQLEILTQNFPSRYLCRNRQECACRHSSFNLYTTNKVSQL